MKSLSMVLRTFESLLRPNIGELQKVLDIVAESGARTMIPPIGVIGIDPSPTLSFIVPPIYHVSPSTYQFCLYQFALNGRLHCEQAQPLS